MQPSHVQTFDFGDLEFHDNFVIGRMKQDTLVEPNIAQQVLGEIKKYYGKRKMVYISDRQLSHSVDLSVYKLIDHKKMVGIAIVTSDREAAMAQLNVEQHAFKGSFGVFDSMDSATSWAESFIEEVQ